MVQKFPFDGMLPKHETQAFSFISNHPEYDGRGTVIAILDTGVDPGSPGLQVTSDGKPKVIDTIDCTGSGDVSMSTVVEATVVTEEDGTVKRTLQGLSGRTLAIGNWENPTGKYRLGVKSYVDLFPHDALDRLKKDRIKAFELEHHKLATSAQDRLAQFERDHPTPSEEEEKIKADLKAQVEVLRDQIKGFKDPGMIFDAVVFHDGTKWRAVVDISQSGNLEGLPLLTNYADERQFVRFDDRSYLNFSVNIYDEGESLSIVSLAGTHGNHVAAITAAYFPEDPRLNGVAPGAQIISLKIGDNRLGSAECSAGLVRAAIELARLKCDLANISYGEAAAIPNQGRFIEILRDEVINKSNCVVVSSAGNEGPALSTLGAPGGTSSGVIGVGAYVCHSMMDAEHSLLKRVDETPYTWSSRGPTTDGDVGVDIFAPGAAITSVPQYTIQAAQLMNGTSMSSPNACGCLALLVSGLKAEGIYYTPYLLKSAIQYSGKDVQDPLGTKFIQVEQAWEHLNKLVGPTKGNYDANDLVGGKKLHYDVHYDISVKDRQNARGIYLRELQETTSVSQSLVSVDPKFPNHDDPAQNPLKLKLECYVSLVTTQKWISAPSHIYINNGGRAFSVRVNPTNLAPGLHFGEVLAIDSTAPELGPLFRVPVTVCKPEVVENALVKYNNLSFEPGTIIRKFVSVPTEANFAELTVRIDNRDAPGIFIAHLVQLQAQTSFAKNEHSYWLGLNNTGTRDSDDKNVYKKTFSVLPGVTLEVCLAQFWSTLDESTVSVEVVFHGIGVVSSGCALGDSSVTAGGTNIWLNSGNNGFDRLDIVAGIRKENIALKANLDIHRRSIRPSETLTAPLKSRDVLPDGRQLHELVLTYTVKTAAAAKTTFRFPKLNDVLYDSAVEGFFVVVFDANKKVVSSQYTFSDRTKNVDLNEGTYTVRAQVVSGSVELLDKLSSMPLIADAAFKAASLPVYSAISDLIAGSSAGLKTKSLKKGERTAAWVGPLDDSSLPKGAQPGDLLIGTVEVAGDGASIDGGLYKAFYLVPSEKKSADKPAKTAEEPKSDAEQLKEAIRDLEISWIKKIKDEDVLKALTEKLHAEYPTHLPLLTTRLEALADKIKSAEDAELLAEIQTLIDTVLQVVDLDQLAIYFGVQHDLTSEREKQRKKEKDAQKDAVILALRTRAKVLQLQVQKLDGKKDEAEAPQESDADVPPVSEKEDLTKQYDQTLEEYAKWQADQYSNGAFLKLWAWRESQKGLYGQVLKHLNKYLAEAKNIESPEWKELSALRREIYSALGWTIWKDYEETWSVLNEPKSYAPF
ncbi:subtilase family-domain-containing protein [Polychytrium aggregatum]|uniref:subtilase family-domain-containing protein n=1 Tax=Polychytrium aggregatum TaxID=110093 RepID=UPI0022FED51B|nr:subtilase family-domain-containing protein [Polychytrium aggregatum]KAI9202127.1 subtilase family-domain-containing protein [Polychytrium aggregatum]